ncbi:MAG: hypothetical protein JW885_10605, partial [Deltaproteobacteria bacterium]|nr:hypothetical protein [Candidatus Zymogenaceae bacterium]
MSERIIYGRRKPFGFIPAIMLIVVCMIPLCALTQTALGHEVPNGVVPEGLFSLIHEANVAGNLVSIIEKDLSIINRHPEATPDERYALKNTLALARVEFRELEKSITDTLSGYYNVDASKIASMRDSGKSWGAIVAGLENGNLFDTSGIHDDIGGGGTVTDGRSTEPSTSIVNEDPTNEDVSGPASSNGTEDESWGYGLDRYAGKNGKGNNANGSGGVGGVGGVSGGNNSNNGIGWGVGGTSNVGGNSNGNNGIGWGV